MISFLVLGFYGLLLGTRHSLEPDHLAAVSTMAAHGSSRRDVIRISAAWGAGHATLLIVAGLLLSLLRWTIPENIGARADWLVGILLIGMGLWTFWRLWAQGVHTHLHAHGAEPPHTHFHRHSDHLAHDPHPQAPNWIRNPAVAYWIGTLHGLGGSGAATALAVVAAPSMAAAAFYLAAFGIGSLLGMVAVGVLAMWPIMQTASRIPRARTIVQALAGTASLVIGILLVTNVL